MITKLFNIFKSHQPTPQELADQAQRILGAEYGKWDIDDYENKNPKDPKLKDLYLRTMEFGLPEEWCKLDGAKRDKLNETIEEMRHLTPRELW
jgi:hypothetical protein